jgi:DNA polymerase-3 subunit epsilon
MNYITMTAFDVETTGLEADKEEIVEIGAVKFTFSPVDGRMQPMEIAAFQQLINPGRPIPPFITEINHINDDMVHDMPPLAAVLPDFMRFYAGSNFLVAHNAEFDADFISHGLARSGLDQGKMPILDSIKIIKKTNFEFRSFKLGMIAKRLESEMVIRQEPGKAHRAFYDCRILAHVLTCCLRKRFPPENFEMLKGVKALTKMHGKAIYFSDFI